MGKSTGFIEYRRALPVLSPAAERIGHWQEFHEPFPVGVLREQAARCMNCGVPFCHPGTTLEGASVGCPLGNLIPEWNDLVYRGQWREAYRRLAATNNFPEFTGRVCPAPCESSCVLGINELPVTIKEIEVAIVDRAFEEGWITPQPPLQRSGKKVAVIGSGPAGLACADELNRRGHSVTVFERDDRPGGLLMYGIPNMKLEKSRVMRRIALLTDEGIEFRTGIAVGKDVTAAELGNDFDAVVLACGAAEARDLPIDGRGLKGIYPAMEFLSKNTKSLLDSELSDGRFIDVKEKDVIVIGGGDTGTDCVATSLRQQCRSVTQFEIMPPPGEKILTHAHWLTRARTFQVDYGQEEANAVFGADPRQFSTVTKRFIGDENGVLSGLETVEAEFINGKLTERVGTEKIWPADCVLLALGFSGAEKLTLFEDLGVLLTSRGTIAVNERKQTSAPKVFAAGDCERGQSLVVWAIADGRDCAVHVSNFLDSDVKF